MWEPEFLEHVIILIKYKRKIGDLLKMGVLDKFLSIMKLDDGDDEYDDDEFFDDDEYDDDYEEKPKRSLFHKNTKDNDKDFDEDDIPVDVHGGITFKGNPFDDEPEEWIGFDTLHFGDGDWITEEYVEMNCRYMIEQLYRLEREGE